MADLVPEFAELAPEGQRRMGANPHRQRRPAAAGSDISPIFALTRSTFRNPGTVVSEATRVLGNMLRDVLTLN